MPCAALTTFIDPFPWHFEIKPSGIADAVRWAVRNGWTPGFGPAKAMELDGDAGDVTWLPGGHRHLCCERT